MTDELKQCPSRRDAYAQALEDAARQADIEAQRMNDLGQRHPEDSEYRARCFARAREARFIAEVIRALPNPFEEN
jgi:hypothetical protein